MSEFENFQGNPIIESWMHHRVLRDPMDFRDSLRQHWSCTLHVERSSPWESAGVSPLASLILFVFLLERPHVLIWCISAATGMETFGMERKLTSLPWLGFKSFSVCSISKVAWIFPIPLMGSSCTTPEKKTLLSTTAWVTREFDKSRVKSAEN